MSLILMTRSMTAAGDDDRVREALNQYGVAGPVGAPADIPEDIRATAKVLVTGGAFGAPRWLVEALPALGLVHCMGSGYEGVDRQACAERGVVVTHNPEGNAASTADHIMCLILACVRHLLPLNRYAVSGQWFREVGTKPPRLRGLVGRKVGILGVGHVGTKVAKRLSGFDVEIAYSTPKPHADVPYPYFDSAESLAAWSDILVVALRGGPATRHIINSAVLKALGPEGYMINTTRGQVVNEAELVEALENKVIAGAGMDVFEHEPSADPKPWIPEALLNHPNVVITPHASAETIEARAYAFDLLRRNVGSFLSSGQTVAPLAAK